jgi:hypothetical protein
MVNLVFVHVLGHPAVAQRVQVFDEMIRDLRSPQGVGILGRKCPTVVKTEWIYDIEALHFVLQDANNVNTVPTVLEQEAVPDKFKIFYRMGLHLMLFSGSMKTRGRKLYEVMPISHETLCRFLEVRNMLSDDEDPEIFNAITTQFVTQLKANSLETIMTA